MPALLHARETFANWNRDLQAVCGNFSTALSDQHTLFIGSVYGQDVCGLELAHIRTNAGLIRRHRTSGDGDDDRHCFLILQCSGHQRIRGQHQVIELGPEDIALVDSAQAFEIEPRGLVQNISIHLSRQEVSHQLGQQPLFGKLARNSVATHMIRALVRSLGDVALRRESGASNDGAALEHALIGLAVAGLDERSGGQPAFACVGHDDLYGLATRLVEASLQDAELGPDYLARQLNVSVRQLYRLFEQRHESISRYIQQRRLERVAQDLRCHELRHESITQIAFKWGFVDAAHFSRAFKRHFQHGPRDFRQQSV
ncbi:transcriptional regulator FeaR [Pseudomonas sp. S35]|uniref:transcriptional regulator FeaR n=1 Tax=Pseudomonas sp. S35 TaxID=1573719 RepID=UPI00135B1A70|nr:transcriptional regulator FeaR [Pseudomonas sp. S35]